METGIDYIDLTEEMLYNTIVETNIDQLFSEIDDNVLLKSSNVYRDLCGEMYIFVPLGCLRHIQ